ncbi:platelet endothelial aggregation receptor 1-like isoform X1 [Mya arenaria]|uniref:platelet endothelial aggregation receptor 1-like isoform X1 n=1 Tax=Mya arenaria TaxID=6604 RepID=UPI0022E4C66C|nr:platelet endothelial aggregation receptor 1-like isoform X1 [Mya arenaria]
MNQNKMFGLLTCFYTWNILFSVAGGANDDNGYDDYNGYMYDDYSGNDDHNKQTEPSNGIKNSTITQIQSKPCLNCSSHQDCVDGKCLPKCPDGFTGNSCNVRCFERCLSCRRDDPDLCLACKIGWYGYEKKVEGIIEVYNCNSQCPNNCANNTCERRLGHCDSDPGCKSSFHGLKCEKKCSEHCNDGVCARITEECLHGCNGGYRGRKCQCPPSHLCQRCSLDLNKCVKCINGLWGDRCLQSCSPLCLNQTCSTTDGTCVYGCRNKMYGPMCLNDCPSTCDVQTDRPTCYTTDGSCIQGCLDGYYGRLCEHKCVGCVNNTCAQETGACVEGCIFGFLLENKTCKAPPPSSVKTQPSPIEEKIEIHVGAGTGGAALLIIVVVVVVLKRKRIFRRRRTPKDKNETAVTNVTYTDHADDENLYDQIPENPEINEYSYIASNQLGDRCSTKYSFSSPIYNHDGTNTEREATSATGSSADYLTPLSRGATCTTGSSVDYLTPLSKGVAGNQRNTSNVQSGMDDEVQSYC